VTFVTVTAVAVGSQYQCTAVAAFSDGLTRNVTNEAAWESSDPTIATVSASTLVTPARTGTVEIRATYQGVTGGLPLAVFVERSARPTSTLSGTIREPLQNPEFVPDVRVEVVDGPNAGRFSTTEREGRYVLPGLLPGTFRVRARRNGYEPAEQTITLSSDTTLDFTLAERPAPSPPPAVTYSVSGTIAGMLENAPLEGARVEIPGGPNTGKSAISDANGFYRLSGLTPGQMTIRASKTGYSSRDRELTLSTDLPVDLLMDRQRFTLMGTVLEVAPWSGGVRSGRVEVVEGLETGKFALTDDGQYRIDGIAWGTLKVRASDATCHQTAETRLMMASDDPRLGRSIGQDFSLPRNKHPLWGVVRESPGNALSVGAVVKLVREPGGVSAPGIDSRTTDAAGTYRFDAIDCGLSWWMRVEKNAFFTPEVSVLILGDTRRDVTIERVSYPLRGIVRENLSGTLLADVTVEKLSGSYAGRKTTTHTDGSYGLQVRDTVTVRASKPGYVSQQATVTVTAPAADQDFSLTRQTLNPSNPP
jgi:hypothetical protein